MCVCVCACICLCVSGVNGGLASKRQGNEWSHSVCGPLASAVERTGAWVEYRETLFLPLMALLVMDETSPAPLSREGGAAMHCGKLGFYVCHRAEWGRRSVLSWCVSSRITCSRCLKRSDEDPVFCLWHENQKWGRKYWNFTRMNMNLNLVERLDVGWLNTWNEKVQIFALTLTSFTSEYLWHLETFQLLDGLKSEAKVF